MSKIRTVTEIALKQAQAIYPHDPSVYIILGADVGYGLPDSNDRRYMHPFAKIDHDGFPYMDPNDWCTIHTQLPPSVVGSLFRANGIPKHHLFEKANISLRGIPAIKYGRFLPECFKIYPGIYCALGNYLRGRNIFAFRIGGDDMLLYRHKTAEHFKIEDDYNARILNEYQEGVFMIIEGVF